MAANNRRPSRGGDWSWTLIILGFIFFWPLGLLLLFGKLFGSDGESSRRQAPPLRGTAASGQGVRSSGGAAAADRPRRETRASRAVKRVTKPPKVKKSNAWLLKIGGALLAFIGLLIADAANGRVWELVQGVALFLSGGAMLYSGFSMNRALKRYTRYLLVMGDREAMPIDELARVLGYSERRVLKDLEKMIDKGYFGGKAYVNVELGYLFRGSGAEAVWQQRQEEAAARAAQENQVPKEAEEGYSGILRNIRRANDRIADPVLSAKISRLEEITAKIFKAVEEDPKKAERIGTFLNYYLPTTQKLLDSYASFEAAGVEGENLRQAKQRIETTMDSIVKGFEHQLDELYQADALDVDTDIRVMEHMLRRDTGTAAQDFGLEEER